MENESQVIWGIHAGRTGDADALFIKKGYIALGWNAIGDLSKMVPTREVFKEAIAQAYPSFKPGAIPVAAGQLFRFIHEAHVGDLVIYRSKLEQMIHIGKIAGEYTYDPALESGYPHLRPAKWIATVAPTQLTQGALYEIGSAMSFFQVRNYAEEWRIHISPGEKPVKTNVPSEDPTIGIVAEGIEELTRDFVLKQLSTELKGHPFATFVAHLLQTMGYRTRISPEGADGGVDIVAHKDELGFEPPIVRVQVKSGNGNVGQPEVSALIGTLSQGEFGLVVTLSGFTSQAKSFAKNKGNLRLIDGEEFVNLTLAHYDQLDARYKGLLPLKRVYVPEPIQN
jgi:restriction system protein